MKNTEQTARICVIAKFLTLFGRKPTTLVSGSEVIDPSVVVFIEAELQQVPSKRPRKFLAVAKDSSEYRNLAGSGFGRRLE